MVPTAHVLGDGRHVDVSYSAEVPTSDRGPTGHSGPRAIPTTFRDRIRSAGSTGWRVVGLLLAISLSYTALVSFSGLVVPFLLAVVVGSIGVPFVDRLERLRVPRPLGALVLIAGLLAVVGGTIWLVVGGIVEESLEIRLALADGLNEIDGWVADGGWIGDPDRVVDDTFEQGRPLLTGAASWATTIFSSAVAFAIGAFLSFFMLYYLLVDWDRITGWLAGHLGVPGETGTWIINDATDVVRRGFGALTLTSAITAAVIGLAMVLLGIPLAAAVAVATFVTSYVPYLGAILSGAFAFLVALGSNGLGDAVAILVVILVAQNVIQTIVGNRLTSDRLSLHPLPSIISSVCGVAIAGLLGAMLSAPALALAIAVGRRVSASTDDSGVVPPIEGDPGSDGVFDPVDGDDGPDPA